MKKFNCLPNCPDRFPGDDTRPNCHMVCPHGYTEWNEEHQKELTDQWEQKYATSIIDGHRDEAVFRALKKRRGKR